MRYWKLLAFGLLLPVSLVGGFVSAHNGTPSLDILKKASSTGGGNAVSVQVTASCPPGHTVIEALIYVTQDDNSSQFGGIPVTCDGLARTTTVTLSAFPSQPFKHGPATSSAYLLIQDISSSETHSAGDSARIVITGSKK